MEGRLPPVQRWERNVNKLTKGAVAAAACVLLFGGAGTLAFSSPDVINVGQRPWAALIVAVGLVGYAAAIIVAAFGKRGIRHVRS